MIQKNKTAIIAFALGVIVMLLLFFGLKKIFGFSNKSEKDDYYIIANQISKMNKMVVIEQDFSAMRKNKVAYQILGKTISENSVVTFTKTNVQVSYDLNQMKIDIDSVNKKLIIKSLPEPEIS